MDNKYYILCQLCIWCSNKCCLRNITRIVSVSSDETIQTQVSNVDIYDESPKPNKIVPNRQKGEPTAMTIDETKMDYEITTTQNEGRNIFNYNGSLMTNKIGVELGTKGINKNETLGKIDESKRDDEPSINDNVHIKNDYAIAKEWQANQFEIKVYTMGASNDDGFITKGNDAVNENSPQINESENDNKMDVITKNDHLIAKEWQSNQNDIAQITMGAININEVVTKGKVINKDIANE